MGRDPIVVVQQYLVLVDAILRREVADASELLDHRLLPQRRDRAPDDADEGEHERRRERRDVARAVSWN